MTREDEIKRAFTEAGTPLVGIARLATFPEVASAIGEKARLGWLAGLGWLSRVQREMEDPSILFDGARSIIATAWSYTDQYSPYIARFAISNEYHSIIKERLSAVWKGIGGGRAYISVDNSPVPEKQIARLAGLGGIGKNSLLINPRLGSYLCIGVIITDLTLRPDPPFEEDLCGGCRACVMACPTGAIKEGIGVDSSRCISYLTIEEKGRIPEDLLPLMGAHIFGCDVCQEVCPYNNSRYKHTPSIPPAIQPPLRIEEVRRWMEMDKEGFKRYFSATPIKRIGPSRFKRNIAIALGNAGGSEEYEFLRRHLQSGDELVDRYVEWAVARLEGGSL